MAKELSQISGLRNLQLSLANSRKNFIHNMYSKLPQDSG